MSRDGYEIHGAVAIYETDDAILVEADEFVKSEWIPKSQITDESEVYENGTDGTLIVTEWFAEKRGWI